MLEVTSPMLLDSTGQGIVTALNAIATNVAQQKVQFIFGPLPVTGVAGNFYFVRNSKSSGSNLYDEYVWDANANRFELISSNVEIDAVPTDGSSNPVSSNGVYDALQSKISGHLVINDSGSDFPQRSKIKFVNATITDDSANDVTVVEVEGGGTTIVQKPTVTVGTYTYNGSAQGPSIVWPTGSQENCVVTNATKVNAGEYTLTIALKNSSKMVWQDLTTADLTFNYTINKAVGTVSVSPSSVTIDANSSTATANVSFTGDGVLTVVNDATTIYNMNYNSSTKVITITDLDETSGTGTVTITLAEGNNYLGATTTLSVTASFKPALVSWGSGTDEEIGTMIDAYYDGVLTLSEIQSVWHIGDTRNVTISAIAASGTGWTVGESHRSQTVQMQILGFDHDTLTTSTGGKTKALITVDTKNVLVDANTSFDGTGGSTNTENGYMESTNTNVNGWTGCARRGWCNNGFYNALPNYFKNRIKQVNKLTSAGNQSATINTTVDYCFLLSEKEIFGSETYAKAGEGTQYAWYANATANHYKMPKWNAASQVSDTWWERSPSGSNATSFCFVNNSGNANNNGASRAYGLAPACSL